MIFLHLFAAVRLPLELCVAVAGSVYLVERRGRQERLDPRRQVDITTILEGIPEAALVVDAEGRIIEANQGAAQLTGMTRDVLRRTTLGDLTRVTARGEQSLEIPRPIFSRVMHGDVVRHERRVLRNPKTGAIVEVIVSANPILNSSGDVMGALLIARDITELAQLQRRIGDIERHHAIGQMAAALAHDFNNVLGAIGQAVTLLQAPAEEAERTALLDIIQTSVRRGAEIIGRIREYLRTGKSALGPVDIRQVMDETVQLTRPLWQRAGVKVEKKLKPVGCVSGNAADLRRVFTNLIINAIEAMPGGGGKITLSCREENGKVIAEVADTGAGIPEDHKKNLFNPYYTTKSGGTGLGLSGAQKIVLSEGGTINFDSQAGKGTRFRLEWPISRSQSGAAEPKKPSTPQKPTDGTRAA